jgi:hypothetical protein
MWAALGKLRTKAKEYATSRGAAFQNTSELHAALSDAGLGKVYTMSVATATFANVIPDMKLKNATILSRNAKTFAKEMIGKDFVSELAVNISKPRTRSSVNTPYLSVQQKNKESLSITNLLPYCLLLTTSQLYYIFHFLATYITPYY